jgi:hypothetical protein
VEKDNEGQSFHIEKSTESYDKKLIGVVSTNPGFILGGGLDENNSRLVALAGRVPVKVSTENGPIEIGDYLTSASSTPGVAMAACAKASASQESTCKAGRVIGMALEPFDGAQGEIGKIMVLINPHWQGNDLSVAQNTEGQLVNISPEELRTGLASLGLIVNENGVLEVDTLKTRQLCVGSVCVTEEEFRAVFGAGSGDSSSGSSDGEPEPVCSADRLDLCTTQELCEGASLYWYDDTCHLGPKTETCAPNWQCSDWQPQIDESLCGQTIGQTRTCTDTNGCGGEEGKPSESQEIEAPECPEPEPEPEP